MTFTGNMIYDDVLAKQPATIPISQGSTGHKPTSSETHHQVLQGAPELWGSMVLAALWPYLHSQMAQGLLPPPAHFHLNSTIFLGLYFQALLLLLPSCRHTRTPSFILKHSPDSFHLAGLYFTPASRCSPPRALAVAPMARAALPVGCAQPGPGHGCAGPTGTGLPGAAALSSSLPGRPTGPSPAHAAWGPGTPAPLPTCGASTPAARGPTTSRARFGTACHSKNTSSVLTEGSLARSRKVCPSCLPTGPGDAADSNWSASGGRERRMKPSCQNF